MSTIGASEESSHPKVTSIGQQQRNCVPSWQRQATHIDSDSAEAPELGWKVLMHSPYIPDPAPSDDYLLLPMANDFAGDKFASKEACENLLYQFFTNRDEGF